MLGWLKRQFKSRSAKKLANELRSLNVDEAMQLAGILAASTTHDNSVEFKRIYIFAHGEAIVPVGEELSKEIGGNISEICQQLKVGRILLREEFEEPTIKHIADKFRSIGAEVIIEDV